MLEKRHKLLGGRLPCGAVLVPEHAHDGQADERPDKPSSLSNRSTTAPYTPEELEAFRTWATSQLTAEKRDRAMLMLVLCAGAGIRSNEMLRIYPEHVTVDADGILVHVATDRPRTVPLLAEWGDWMRALLRRRPAGEPLPGKKHTDRKRWNTDAMSGRYSREGTHEGTGHEADKAGWEAETVVTVANQPGAPDSFPVMTTAMTVHQPGMTRHGGRIAMWYHSREFTRDERHLLMTDMLYPGLSADNFQLPVAKMGFRTVWDMRKARKEKKKEDPQAIHGVVDDAIAVDGCLYLKWMPEHLISATVDYRRDANDPKRTTEESYYAYLKARTPYRVMGKGRPEEDGSFRFYYPTIDTKKRAYIDRATGLDVKRPTPRQKTLTVSPDIPEHMRIKQLQMFELRSEDWRKWYGMRNRVEEHNYWLKHDGFSDLGNPEKRRARGYAYQTLTAGIAAAVSNMRRIVSFIANAAINAIGETALRNLRRYDEDGNPIPHR